MRINIDGPMFASRRAVQRMLAGGGGCIINIASGMARAMAFAALAPAQLEAGDIADVALFLASYEGRHVDGALVSVDGGWSAI